LEDSAVRKWLVGYDEISRQSRFSYLKDFLGYLKENGFGVDTPCGLVEFQKRSKGDGEDFKILDLLQDYIRWKGGTHTSLKSRYSAIQKFFRSNRAPLPPDDFRIKADREPVQGRLTVEIIKSLISDVELGWKAFYLTLWMGIMDLERFIQFNNRYGYALANHLKCKGVDTPFLITFSGRKENRNKKIFHTFIGRDALTVWQQYFERVRGWPQDGEAALLNIYGRPVGKDALRTKHIRTLEGLNYLKRGGSISKRYGYNLHEFRDVARTLLHLQGKSDGLDLECVEYWMGHNTDPNHYDKFYNDKDYLLSQYRIAEKYLNIISGVQPFAAQDTKELAQQMVKNPETFKIFRDALEEIVGAKLAPVEGKRKD
jgi:hypothetical protein